MGCCGGWGQPLWGIDVLGGFAVFTGGLYWGLFSMALGAFWPGLCWGLCCRCFVVVGGAGFCRVRRITTVFRIFSTKGQVFWCVGMSFFRGTCKASRMYHVYK